MIFVLVIRSLLCAIILHMMSYELSVGMLFRFFYFHNTLQNFGEKRISSKVRLRFRNRSIENVLADRINSTVN